MLLLIWLSLLAYAYNLLVVTSISETFDNRTFLQTNMIQINVKEEKKAHLEAIVRPWHIIKIYIIKIHIH